MASCKLMIAVLMLLPLNTGMNMDKYGSFAALRAAELPSHFGVDFEDRAESGAIVIAPHGGKIEARTSEIARRIAADRFSYYSFEGRKNNSNRDLHITSHHFDEPTGLALVLQHRWVVAIHGCTGDKSRVLLGGRDIDLRSEIASGLAARGIVSEDHGHSYAGTDPNNICNRGMSGGGVQIELTMHFRTSNAVSSLVAATYEALSKRAMLKQPQ